MEKLKKEKNIKSQKGITLIALLITVIVLIILATITISMLTDETSVTDKTAEVKTESDYNAYEEQIKLSVIESYNYDKSNDNIDLEKLNKAINEKLKIEDDEKVNITELPAYIKIKDMGFSILENGDVQRNPSAFYQKVEYIESSGTQWIDTGYKPNNNTRIIAEVSTSSYGNAAFFGAGNTEYSQAICSYIERSGKLFRGFHNDRASYSANAPLNTKYEIELSKSGFFYNGNKLGSITSSSFNVNYSLYILDFNVGGKNKNVRNNKIRLYSFKIYEENELIQNLIPCYNKVDGEVGMYDIVSDSFFENKGTGTFEKGEDIK